MWLMVIGLTLGTLGIWATAPRDWRGARHLDLGWMSQQWLSEHRASRYESQRGSS